MRLALVCLVAVPFAGCSFLLGSDGGGEGQPSDAGPDGPEVVDGGDVDANGVHPSGWRFIEMADFADATGLFAAADPDAESVDVYVNRAGGFEQFVFDLGNLAAVTGGPTAGCSVLAAAGSRTDGVAYIQECSGTATLVRPTGNVVLGSPIMNAAMVAASGWSILYSTDSDTLTVTHPFQAGTGLTPQTLETETTTDLSIAIDSDNGLVYTYVLGGNGIARHGATVCNRPGSGSFEATASATVPLAVQQVGGGFRITTVVGVCPESDPAILPSAAQLDVISDPMKNIVGAWQEGDQQIEVGRLSGGLVLGRFAVRSEAAPISGLSLFRIDDESAGLAVLTADTLLVGTGPLPP